RVHRVGCAGDHLAGERQHPFGARGIDHGEGGAVRLDYALGDAVMIAQVDEDQPAMVTPPVDPARQTDSLADVGPAKLAAGMGTIGVHGAKPLENAGFWRFWEGRSRAGKAGPDRGCFLSRSWVSFRRRRESCM